jgi:hypothetical protein
MADTITFEALQKKTVAELRDIAKALTHEAVQGYTQMNKEHLLPALCKALGIDSRAHHHVIGGFDKASIKGRMRMLRMEKNKALEEGDSTRVKALRGELHSLNHRLRAHIR